MTTDLSSFSIDNAESPSIESPEKKEAGQKEIPTVEKLHMALEHQ